MSPQEIPKKTAPSSSSSPSRRKIARRQAETLDPNSAADDPKLLNSVKTQLAPPTPPSPPSASGGGFDGLERRPFVLHDGIVRYYYALPPDYSVGPAHLDRRLPPQEKDYWSYLGLDEQWGPPPAPKRKREDENDWLRESVRRYGNPSSEGDDGLDSLGKARALDEYDRHRESVRRYGNPNGDLRFENLGRELKKAEAGDGLYSSGEARAINKAFLTCSKLINESLTERMRYLEDGKNGPLRCFVCGRTSKAYSRVHDLIMHAYTCEISELRIDHLGLHKALCVLMGWNYTKAPDTSKAYQSLSADEAAANKENLIVWPPTVIVHNTNTGRRKDGHMVGMSDKEVDMQLKEMGFTGGTSKSLYGKGGHLGIAAVKFASNPSGLEEAKCLAEYFKNDKRGREGWVHVEASQPSSSDEKCPVMTLVDKKTGEKKNILYGYLATASDLEKVDIDTRKRAVIMTGREFVPSD